MDIWIYNGDIEKPLEISQLKEELIENPSVLAFFDSEYLICKEQLLNAILLTHLAYETKTNFSSTFGIELLLKLSGETQIKNALSYFELKETSKTVVIVSTKPLELDSMRITGGLPFLTPNDNVKHFYKKMNPTNQDELCDFAIAKSVESLIK